MIFDPMYFLFLAPAMLLAMIAQLWLKSAYATAQNQPAPLSGAAAARMILDHNGLNHVSVQLSQGMLSDHYDPRAKTVRLSPEVYHSRSLAAVGIAAHETGHAIQDAESYSPLVLRNAMVPLASTGGNISMGVFFVGLLLSGIMPFVGKILVLAAIGLFSVAVFFQLVNLPVEFDASRRAKLILADLNVVDTREGSIVSRVLSAAAMTYVAATASSIMTLLYLVLRSGVLGGNNRD